MTAAVPGSGTPRRAELGLRIVSSLVLAPLALGAAYAGYPWLHLMLGCLAVAMAVEWTRMALPGDRVVFAAAITSGTAVFAIAAFASGLPVVALAGVAVGAALALAIGGAAGGWAGFGVVYVAVPCLCAAYLRQAGALVFLAVLLAVWATDIGAYAAGRSFGGPRLAPRVSPGKTWAGLLGGMAAAAFVCALLARLGSPGAGGGIWAQAALGGALLAVVAQAGDLFESWVKRRSGVKDSGGLIPGHGGVLDRVDGLLSALPVAAGVLWLQEIGMTTGWR